MTEIGDQPQPTPEKVYAPLFVWEVESDDRGISGVTRDQKEAAHAVVTVLEWTT
ncbi:hypothetical protein [Spongiactinospora sp. TRM90649]|uniref:hypothetical protein n=1 Tax=Spongiactinospora sp. TRM90649 TaxID=3031114 RepID=UPI0023F8B779|nr:hypothetical protein [Spongiactinospora sp. TRM90649]MDF5754936.1 hypothetical protein [Spongiactinospora sp. TRM90649]